MPGRPFVLASSGVLGHENGIYPISLNDPPTASFTLSQSANDVDFTDTSSDPDNNISSWDWDFGDGTTSTKQNPSHSYANTGSYTVSLTVTDKDGATDTASKSLTVSEVILTGFEGGAVSNAWTFRGNTGDWSWTANTANPLNGSYAMEWQASIDGTSLNAYSMPGDGFDAYPEPGDTFEIGIAHGNWLDMTFGIRWGYQNSNNYYQYSTHWDSEDVILRDRTNGSNTQLDSSLTGDIANSGYMKFWVDWQTDGTMTCELRNPDDTTRSGTRLKATDTTHGAGGVEVGGYAANGFDYQYEVYFDSLKILNSG